jgi:integrase
MAKVRKRKWTYKGKTREVWIVDYFDAEGVRRQKSFEKKRDANDRLDEIKGQLRSGVHTPDSISITVKEAGDIWIAACKNRNLERSTTREYEAHLDRHIIPYLGTRKLSQLKRPMIKKFVDDLLADGRSVAMAKKALTSLGSLIAEGEARGLVAQNVARGHRLPSLKRRNGKAEIPSLEEINVLVTNAKGRWRPYVITATFTGLRSSEMRALKWSDVIFDAKEIHVHRRADRWNEIGDPKSEAGHRKVPMTPMVLNTLKAWKKECPEGVLDLVFPNGSGNIENHGNIFRRGFAPLQVECGMYIEKPAAKEGEEPIKKAKYGLHALRHAAASLFIQYAGYQPKKVQTVMGHSSIQMTFDTYGHLFPSPDDDQEAMAKIEAQLFDCDKSAAKHNKIM